MLNSRHNVEQIPADLNPLVTAHPASCAYRALGGLAAQTWSHDDALAMAHAVIALDRERKSLKQFLWDIGCQDDGAAVARKAFPRVNSPQFNGVFAVERVDA